MCVILVIAIVNVKFVITSITMFISSVVLSILLVTNCNPGSMCCVYWFDKLYCL